MAEHVAALQQVQAMLTGMTRCWSLASNTVPNVPLPKAFPTEY